jgi:hypothetical protein
MVHFRAGVERLPRTIHCAVKVPQLQLGQMTGGSQLLGSMGHLLWNTPPQNG